MRIVLAIIVLLAGATLAHAQSLPDLVPDVAGIAPIADVNDPRPFEAGAGTMEFTPVASATAANPKAPRFARLVEWRDRFTAWGKASQAPFPALYISFAALQVVDVHSTRRAIGRGSVEANVALRGLARSPIALTLVKETAAASTIYLVERVRKRSRKAAILTMVGLNSAYGIIVATNYHR